MSLPRYHINLSLLSDIYHTITEPITLLLTSYPTFSLSHTFSLPHILTAPLTYHPTFSLSLTFSLPYIFTTPHISSHILTAPLTSHPTF